MFINKHTNAPVAKEQRHVDRFVSRANGAEDRVAAARLKRACKNTKRVRDAFRTEIGQRMAAEGLGVSFSSAGLAGSVLVGSGGASDQQWADWADKGWRIGNEDVYTVGEKGTVTIGDHVYTGVELISHEVELA